MKITNASGQVVFEINTTTGDVTTGGSNLSQPGGPHTHAEADVTGLTAALAAKQATSEKGQANGYASLDASGKVPSAQLPASSGLQHDSIAMPPFFRMANLTAVTAFATNTSYFIYLGKVSSAISTLDIRCRVTTAAATITWAEVGVFTGAAPAFGGNASLTRRGFTNVAATFNGTGQKTTTVALTGVSANDELWLAFGSQATTPFQLRGGLADDIQVGWFATFAGRISLAASPQVVTLGSATFVPPWCAAKL